MKSITRVLLFCTILFCLSGCRKTKYIFMNDTSLIDSIAIVELSDNGDGMYSFVETVIAEVEDVDEFLTEFQTIECHKHIGDPIQLEYGDTAIRICYNNGEYELITCDAQMKNRLDRYSDGYCELDAVQFEVLITKYTTEKIGTGDSS